MKRIAIGVLVCVAFPACGSSAPKAATPEPSALQTTTTALERDTISAICNATAQAATAASAAYYATTTRFPTTFADLLDGKPPVLEVGPGVQRAATALTHPNDWKLTMTGGGSTEPTFVCTVLRPIPTIP